MTDLESDDLVLPSGTVTFLLADVEGSTQLWESGAEAMSASMERLGELTEEIVSRHDGARPVEQGEGDSFVAGFARASAAMACALDLQCAIANEQWPGPALQVRIGLHTGEARLRDDGRNYAGEAMNRSARLRNLGHGGQTLLSRSTYELVAESLPAGATLRDLGPHRLRDLQRPEHVWQLTHPDLREDFPPLRSLESMPNNLPTQITSFVGRTAEMDDVRALLRQHRIVTLHGSGGVGKTRLAVEVAATLLDEYPDGVWLVDLSSTNSAGLVPKAVATAAAVREVPTRTTTDLLLVELRDKRTLIVLDNCEHLTEACAELAEQLIRSCAHVSILATSREMLGVPGEVPWRVPSLSLPASAEAISEADAVKLFRDRAATSRPNFKITDANVSAVTDICRQLEGIPLAIELAAARVRVLTPQQIARGLTDLFHLLRGGRRALPRQRTLEASVDWSYNLLSEEERVVLRRLSVFAGGFTLDAAEDVSADENVDAYRVLDLLSALVDKSLVQMDDEGEEARYTILETIRQYAAQRLVDAGEGPELGAKHLRHYLHVAETTRLDRAPVDDLAAVLGHLEAEHDNLRSALEWAVRTERAGDAMRLGVALTGFWSLRGHEREGFHRLATVVVRPPEDPSLHCEALACASFLSATVDVNTGVRYGEEGVGIARELEDPRLVARSLIGLARASMFADPAAAEEACREALPIAQQIRDRWSEFIALLLIGNLEMQRGEVRSARDSFESALRVSEGRADTRAERAWVLYGLGFAAAFTGDVTEAEAFLEQSLTIAREIGVVVVTSETLSALSQCAVLRGDLDGAARLLAEAERVGEKLGLAGWSLVVARGILHTARGQHVAAAAEIEAAVRISRAQGNANGIAVGLAMLGGAVSTFDLSAARAHVDESMRTAREIGTPMALSWAAHSAGVLARIEGDLGRDEVLQHEALLVGMESANKIVVVYALEELAGLAAASGSFDEAARLLGAADAVRTRAGFRNLEFRDMPNLYWNDIAATREGLGDDAYERAWAEGAAMSLDEVVAYVQRGRGPRERPSAGWDSLTPAERDVVRLVAEGMSNKEIAEKLFVSPRTVQTHLTHVYSKLGISSRVQLVQEALTR